MIDEAARLRTIRAAFPDEGLFAEKEWLLSPEPFQISDALYQQLEKLGHRLHLFVRACNELYQRSASGKQPGWIADYLDRGKPPELVEFSRRKEFRNDIPRVIRPDLVLTEEGFTLAELDSVPGGLGLTGWLNETYARLGYEVVGGERGMVDGFAAIAPNADILVSKEAATYRPEMEWLAGRSRISDPRPESEKPGERGARVVEAETYAPERKPDSEIENPKSIYRFFELFDLPNIASAHAVMEAAVRGEVQVTPPFKPYLEEKMWFALFWLRPLREFWRRELSERHFLELQKHIPYTWLLDPQPLPQHAVIPGLEIQSWQELVGFSQKQRELILKISGFHETAWGSRSVVLGSDVPQGEWQAAVEHALAEFNVHPHILQRFHKAKSLEQRYFAAADVVETMRGRVRLCPYYFLIDGKAELRGALATICPADKKLLHGMKDAILAPTAVAEEKAR